MRNGPVHVDDAGRTNKRIAIEIDNDGDIQFTYDDYTDGEIWITPADLVAALKELGVLPEDADHKREATPRRPAETPSDRVRESWRQAARDDEAERQAIAVHAHARRVREQRAREHLAKLAGPHFYRDADGDVWRTLADGRLTLYRMRSGTRLDVMDPKRREVVTQYYGPLTEVPDPFGVTPAYPDNIARLRAQVRHDITRSSRWGNF